MAEFVPKPTIDHALVIELVTRACRHLEDYTPDLARDIRPFYRRRSVEQLRGVVLDSLTIAGKQVLFARHALVYTFLDQFTTSFAKMAKFSETPGVYNMLWDASAQYVGSSTDL